MSTKNTLLEKLEERKKKLDAEIRKAKAVQAKKELLLHADKCRIVGAAILLECENNSALMKTVALAVEKHTSSSKDRKTYGLEPLPKMDKK